MFSLNPRTVPFFFVALSFILVSNGFASENQPAFDAIAKDIQAAVKALEYPDEVGQDLVKMVKDWKCVEWKQKLSQAKQDLEKKKILADQAAQVEQEVAKELFEKIRKGIASEDDPFKHFDLAKLLRTSVIDFDQGQKANSISYSQLFSILGKSLGLSIKIIDSLEPLTDPLPAKRRHVNCGVELSDGKMVVVDFACESLSKPFVLKEAFTKDGNYWEAKDKSLLGIHSRIQLWDDKGLLAAIYNCRGAELAYSRTHAGNISYFNKAIEMNPKYAEAYFCRGSAYRNLNKLSEALSDFDKAIEINPKLYEAFILRGSVYSARREFSKAISDYDKAIEINPELAEAYFIRGHTFYNCLKEYAKALSDLDKAITIDPKRSDAFLIRGFVHGKLGQYSEEISDYDKVIVNNPKYALAYLQRGIAKVNLGDREEGKKDLLKALELDSTMKTRVNELSKKYSLDLFPDI